ncbi:hypothetical protein ACLPJK_26385 [Pseudomonas aeruginosa]|uniref:hypothetical protein n=1 Tax=Pseudomonas aeruginosa TaxID=287 RepID=UPI003D2E88CE
MQSLLNRLSVSLESSEMPENVEINPVTTNTVTELTEVLDDLVDETVEVKTASDVVTTLGDAAVSMEGYLNVLNTFKADGGMTPQTAAMYNHGLSDRLSGIPLARKENLFVSLEAFGGSGEKALAHEASTKGLLQKLRDLWTAIYNAVSAFLSKVKTWAKGLLSVGDALIKSGKSLTQAAGLVKTESKETFDTGRRGKTIAISGHIPSDPATVLTVLIGALEEALVGYPTQYSKLIAPVSRLLGNGDTFTSEELNKAVEEAVGVAKGFESSEHELPGGVKYVITANPNVSSASDLHKALTSSLVSETAEAPPAIQLWSKNDLIKVGDGVERLGGVIKRYESKFESAVTAQEKFLKEGSKLVSGNKEFTKDEASAAKQILSEFSKLAHGAIGASPEVVAHAGRVSKALVAVGLAMVSKHTGSTAAIPSQTQSQTGTQLPATPQLA